MNGYNFYNGQQIFMIPYNNAAHCQNYNYNMDYNNYNNTNSFDEKIHNPEQPEDVEEGEEIEVVTVPNEIIESEENVSRFEHEHDWNIIGKKIQFNILSFKGG